MYVGVMLPHPAVEDVEIRPSAMSQTFIYSRIPVMAQVPCSGLVEYSEFFSVVCSIVLQLGQVAQTAGSNHLWRNQTKRSAGDGQRRAIKENSMHEAKAAVMPSVICINAATSKRRMSRQSLFLTHLGECLSTHNGPIVPSQLQVFLPPILVPLSHSNTLLTLTLLVACPFPLPLSIAILLFHPSPPMLSFHPPPDIGHQLLVHPFHQTTPFLHYPAGVLPSFCP
eukprot:766984-Hanusia_phi.AAC.5